MEQSSSSLVGYLLSDLINASYSPERRCYPFGIPVHRTRSNTMIRSSAALVAVAVAGSVGFVAAELVSHSTLRSASVALCSWLAAWSNVLLSTDLSCQHTTTLVFADVGMHIAHCHGQWSWTRRAHGRFGRGCYITSGPSQPPRTFVMAWLKCYILMSTVIRLVKRFFNAFCAV